MSKESDSSGFGSIEDISSKGSETTEPAPSIPEQGLNSFNDFFFLGGGWLWMGVTHKHNWGFGVIDGGRKGTLE